MSVENENPNGPATENTQSNTQSVNADTTHNNQTGTEQRPPIQSFIPGQQAEGAEEATGGAQVSAPKKRGKMWLYGGVILIILIAIGLLLAGNRAPHAVTTTTSIITTTITQPPMAEIQNCTTITKPGVYYLTKSITVAISKGACIYVNSSNVKIIGNYNKISGNGPYVGVPPFTYGIKVSNAKNVTIDSIALTQFSFGIYFYNVENSTISNSNVTKNTISNIYLDNSYFNKIKSTTAAFSSSTYGGIYIEGGWGNLFLNDNIYGNAYYGFAVNSTGNRFINDTLTNNPEDFVCYKNAGFSSSNLFSNVKCNNNLGCNFAWCSQSNKELNMSQIALSENITGCGSINAPGTYTLAANISATNYFNMSNPASKQMACISINSPSVVLNCNGYTIKDAGYALKLSGNYNDTIKNCVLQNNTVGLYLNNSFYPEISNMTFINNRYGLYMNNMNSGYAYNIKGSGNDYGLFINNSNSFTLSNFNFSNNKYGLFANTGGSNIYNNGVLQGNRYGDVYCTALSYNKSPSMFVGVSCGLTDCNWATCAKRTLPPISLYPLNNCTAITIPGNYTLTSNIKATPNCFTIKVSNVSLSCNNYYIVGTGSGSAFLLSNVSNIYISGCKLSNFGSGFTIRNSSYITIKDSNIKNVGYGIDVYNLTYGKILNNNVTTFYNTGFRFEKTSSSIITMNNATNGINNANGFVIGNSTNNILGLNNAVQNAGYGFLIYNSNKNNIFNNTAYSNNIDYYCSPYSSGIYAELNGVNFGGTKYNCHWLVELNSQSPSLTPLSISTSSTIILTQDILYTYGATLYNIYNTKQSSANNTVINCNYHTVLATNGGVFANIANSSNVKIENCYIKNFTYGIRSYGSYLNAINNTITDSNVGISVSNAAYPKITNNTILNTSYGMLFVNTNYGTINKNYIANSNISIELGGGLGYQITGNKAYYGNIGLYIINSTTNILQNNIFANMARYGITCTGIATNSSISLNKDYGNNVCSSNYGCYWMSSSPLCKP